ncbi:MAG TPA: LLM class flavin-dependent oxidoreductase [Candidatus Limnocylindrales bacterium]|nr:LLM class flavin-dependent oxidoreductase [Candidatus Limnocylindrales bacterium]
MRIGAILSPVADWQPILAAARRADEAGLDAVGFWDHYHSGRPDWAYACGWSAYGAVAASTSRVRLVPMVLNNLHYEPGVLAKESSILSIASGGRFELAIGAGDWPESFAAWGREFPSRDERLDRLVETAKALRLVWSGEEVSYDGRYVKLSGAICTPPPPRPPRIVIGVGPSRRTLARALDVADEVNVYDDRALIADALAAARDAPRPVDVSVFVSWEWDKWPADPAAEVRRLADTGVSRAYVSLGGEDMTDRVDALADAAQSVAAP